MPRELTGLQKAAVLLVQLGREHSAKVLAQLRDTEVEKLGAEIMRLGVVDQAASNEVLVEFHEMARQQRFTSEGGLDFAKEVLLDVFGADRADDIVQRLAATMADMPFSFLHKADPRQVLSFLKDEHPQVIAMVLAHLPAPVASPILAGLDGELQADVAHRVAVMDRTSPEIVRQVESVLERKLSSVLQPVELSTVGGVQPLVEMINRADRTTERLILEGLDARSPELAEQVRSKMFLFEDIVLLEDRAIQLVMRQVEASDLASALKGVRDDVRDKVMRNMSERAAENLADEIDMLGTIRLRAVEEAQAKVVHAIRALEATGQIVVRRGDDDEFVS